MDDKLYTKIELENRKPKVYIVRSVVGFHRELEKEPIEFYENNIKMSFRPYENIIAICFDKVRAKTLKYQYCSAMSYKEEYVEIAECNLGLNPSFCESIKKEVYLMNKEEIDSIKDKYIEVAKEFNMIQDFDMTKLAKFNEWVNILNAKNNHKIEEEYTIKKEFDIELRK